MFEFDDAVLATMTLPDGKKQTVVLKHVAVVDSIRFIRLGKADSSIVKLMTGKGIGSDRVLGSTNIFETLVNIRDAEQDSLNEVVDEPKVDKVEDLGLDAPIPKKKRTLSSSGTLSDVLTISAPSRAGVVEGIRMRVLPTTSKRGAVLWVELNDTNIEYLRAVIADQIENVDVDRSVKRGRKEVDDSV